MSANPATAAWPDRPPWAAQRGASRDGKLEEVFDMPDIRQSVQEDRGILKKIQNVIPGFRGYRKREDIRAADSLLRVQMADRMRDVKGGIEESRRMLVDNMMIDHVEQVGGIINKLMAVEGRVRHAEQGYTGFSPAVRIEEEELNRLYEYDLMMVQSINDLTRLSGELKNAIYANDNAKIHEQLDSIRANLNNFTRAFEERIPRIAGIYNMG